MLSGYVKSAFLNISAANKVAELSLVALNSGTNFRLLGIQFIPSVWGPHISSGVKLRSSTAGDVFFEDEICSGDVSSNAAAESFHSLAPLGIPSHGVFVSSTSGVTAQGTGEGINFISVTYQIG